MKNEQAEFWSKVAERRVFLALSGSILEVWGKLRFILDFGFDLSDMNNVVTSVAAASNIEIFPDPAPGEGFFYRSDHYAFVKKGIPAIFLLGGPAMNPSVLFTRAAEWQETHYHMPTDVVQADWNWEGARMLSAFGLVTGMRIANRESMPAWKPGSPYKRKRAYTRSATNL